MKTPGYKLAAAMTALAFLLFVTTSLLNIGPQPMGFVGTIFFTAVVALFAFGMVWMMKLLDRATIEEPPFLPGSWRDTPQEVKDDLNRERSALKERFVKELRESAEYESREQGGGRYPGPLHRLRWRRNRRELKRRAKVRSGYVREERMAQLQETLEELESSLDESEVSEEGWEQARREAEEARENLQRNVEGFAERLRREEGTDSALEAFVQRHGKVLWINEESREMGARVLAGEENVKLVVGRDLLPHDPVGAAKEARRQGKAAELANEQGLGCYVNWVDYRSTLLVFGDVEEIATVLEGLGEAGHKVRFPVAVEREEDAKILRSLGEGLVGSVSMVPWVKYPVESTDKG